MAMISQVKPSVVSKRGVGRGLIPDKQEIGEGSYPEPRGARVLPVGELVLWYGMFTPCGRLLGTMGFAHGAPFKVRTNGGNNERGWLSRSQ